MLPQPKYPTFGYNIFNLLSCEINWLIEVRVWSEVPLNGTCSGWRGKSTNNRIFALILGQNEPSVQIMAQGFSLLTICAREKLTYPSLSLFSIKISPTMQINMFIHIWISSILEYWWCWKTLLINSEAKSFCFIILLWKIKSNWFDDMFCILYSHCIIDLC